MGCGFVAVVPEAAAGRRGRAARRPPPGTRRIGTVTRRAPGTSPCPGALLVRPGLALVAARPDPVALRTAGRRAGHALVGRLASQSSRASEISSPSRSDRSSISSASRSRRSACSWCSVIEDPPTRFPLPSARARRASRAGRRASRRAARACAPRSGRSASRACSRSARSRWTSLDPQLLGLRVRHRTRRLARGGRSRWRGGDPGAYVRRATWSDELPSIVLIVPSVPTDSTTPMCSSQTIRSPGWGCTPGAFGTALPARCAQA